MTIYRSCMAGAPPRSFIPTNVSPAYQACNQMPHAGVSLNDVHLDRLTSLTKALFRSRLDESFRSTLDELAPRGRMCMAATTPAQGMTPRRLVRKLLLGLLGLVGLALLILVTLPYIVSLDSIKGQLVAHLEAALQRQVDVGAVHLQLLSGLGADVEDVTIDNPPGWQQPYFMKAGRLAVKVAWRPLLRRQVKITKLLLSDGDIIIEREAQGRWNLMDHTASTPASTETLPAQVQRSTAGEKTQARSNPLAALSVSEVVLQKMRITFVDRLLIPGQETITALRNVQLRVQDVALGRPMPIDLLATISTDDNQHIRLQGSVGPIPDNLAVESMPIDLHLRATDIRLDPFAPYLGSMLPAPTVLRGTVQLQATLTGSPHDLQSEAQVDLHEIALRSGTFNGGAQGHGGVLLETDQANIRLVTQVVNTNPPHVRIDAGVQRLSFDRQETHRPAPAPKPQSGPTTKTPPSQPKPLPVTLDGQVSVSEGRLKNLDFQQMTADFHLSDGLLKTTQQMTLYGGSYQGAMQVDVAASEPSYTLDGKLTGLDVGQVVNELTPAKNALRGVLDTDMRLVGQGMTWDVINKTLSGNGSAKINEAQLTSVDLFPKLGQLLRELGGPVGLTISKAWGSHAFRTIEGDWRLHQGKILTDHLRLRGEGVEALLKGYVGLDQSIEYAGDLFLPAQFSARRDAPTRLPQDEAGRVVVPFTVKGTVTEPRISISEKALANLAQGELADTVRKRLGDQLEGIFGKPSAPHQQRQESDQTGQEKGDQPPRQDLPGKILRELFRR
jgi:AsmA-like protein